MRKYPKFQHIEVPETIEELMSLDCDFAVVYDKEFYKAFVGGGYIVTAFKDALVLHDPLHHGTLEHDMETLDLLHDRYEAKLNRTWNSLSEAWNTGRPDLTELGEIETAPKYALDISPVIAMGYNIKKAEEVLKRNCYVLH